MDFHNEIIQIIANNENLTSYEYIGSGGEGYVYKANFNDIIIALKLFYKKDYQKFRSDREISALKNLNSNNFPKIIFSNDIKYKDNEYRYVAYQFINGLNLKKLLMIHGQLSVEKVKSLIIDISTAIDDLWELDIVHCDIKPENIIYNHINDKFVLIDLGIAKHLAENTYTQYGTLIGTLGFISPETLYGRSGLTLRSDYFSLGIVSYIALKGKHPFNNDQNLIFKETDFTKFFYDLDNSPVENMIRKLLNRTQYKRPLNSKKIIEELE